METELTGTLTSLPFFTPHWTIIGWIITLVFSILLLTPLWKYIWEVALIFNCIGWLCAFYAGFTANWFIGWFAWIIPLSIILFARFTLEYMTNLPEPTREDK